MSRKTHDAKRRDATASCHILTKYKTKYKNKGKTEKAQAISRLRHSQGGSMTLFEQWNKRLQSDNVTKEEWDEYLAKELHFYKDLLSEYGGEVDGQTDLKARRAIPELMEKYKVKNVEAIGLFDGINESLTTALSLDQYDEESEIEFEVDFKKLYLNMLKAKATWLSSLEEWNHILSQNSRREIRDQYLSEITAKSQKEAGRNDPCPCGSGKKYKKCCGAK